MREFIACTDCEKHRVLIRVSCIEFVEQFGDITKISLSNGYVEYVTETVDMIADLLDVII